MEYVSISICSDILIDILKKNVDEMKKENSHANRMYVLGVIHIAQFANDIKVQNIIQDAMMFMNSTLPEVN